MRASQGGGSKPVLLVQAGIHAGEIDGKDERLMLLRDIALRGKDRLLDRVDLVFVPIFNADGHERSGRWNRPNQRGPRSMGWRTTAQNLNLNRDYLKADTPEMRAMLALIERLDPALYLDLHVTDGTDHQYDITYAFSGWRGYYAQSPTIGRWLDMRLRPSTDAALKQGGHIPGFYVSAVDNADPDKGISHDPDTPRFSTGYGDLRRMPAVLLETHSLKPYRQRVVGTYIFVEQALRLVGAERQSLARAIAADGPCGRERRCCAGSRSPSRSTRSTSWASRTTAIDRPHRGATRSAGSAARSASAMPVLGQSPALTIRLPVAWCVPATAPEAIERLRLHGIAFETIAAPVTRTLDMVRLTDPLLGAASESHVPLTAGFAHERRPETTPTGSVRVPADQPRALLAAALLEAESPDSLLAWNYFPAILQRTEYIEGYAIAPLANRMLATDPALKAEFKAKLPADPAFAANGQARLAWFYARTPYFDERYLLYPIAREIR